MTPGKTPVLFDEVQGYPAVRMAIKFLVENGWFVYIKSGSLPGVRHKEERSCVASRPRCHEQAVFSYIVVGRIPEAVQTYADTHDIAKVVFKQNEILEPHRLDIAKCAECQHQRDERDAEGRCEENRRLHGGGHVKGQAPEGRNLLPGTLLSSPALSDPFAV